MAVVDPTYKETVLAPSSAASTPRDELLPPVQAPPVAPGAPPPQDTLEGGYRCDDRVFRVLGLLWGGICLSARGALEVIRFLDSIRVPALRPVARPAAPNPPAAFEERQVDAGGVPVLAIPDDFDPHNLASVDLEDWVSTAEQFRQDPTPVILRFLDEMMRGERDMELLKNLLQNWVLEPLRCTQSDWEDSERQYQKIHSDTLCSDLFNYIIRSLVLIPEEREELVFAKNHNRLEEIKKKFQDFNALTELFLPKKANGQKDFTFNLVVHLSRCGRQMFRNRNDQIFYKWMDDLQKKLPLLLSSDLVKNSPRLQCVIEKLVEVVDSDPNVLKTNFSILRDDLFDLLELRKTPSPGRDGKS